MAFTVNGQEPINGTDTYLFIPKHRIKGNINASIWTVNCQIEYKLADTSIKKGYIELVNSTKTAYNLLKTNGKIQVVGYNRIRSDLKLTKHVNSSANLWHGYPADHISNQQDRPNETTLKNLFDNNVIDKQEMCRIIRGKKL